MCALYLDTITENDIKSGMDISEELLAQLLDEDEKRYAFKIVFDYISFKMRTEKEVREKLRSRKISDAAAESVVLKIKELGYIDDREYAEVYVQELSEKYGKAVIERKLQMKGVSRDLILEFTSGLEQKDLALACAEKLFVKYGSEDVRKAKQKAFRTMVSKGFSFDEIRTAIDCVFKEEQ